ncbi:MAG: PspC domain-containing protein [Candidatus Hydrogenedentes bacterium]|nr:PspC domain-containing protein [Candidatus Hydrogenedentota bacterium]
MRLTKKQEHRIAKYLSDVGRYLGDLPDDDRDRAIGQLKARLGRELRQFGADEIQDAQVDTALANCGSPAQQAARLLAGRAPAGYSFLAWPDRVWLGVVGGLARQLGVEPGPARFIVVLLGLVPPLLPLLLIVYLVAYFVAYYSGRARDLPGIKLGAVVRSALTAIVSSVALFFGAKLLFLFIGHVYLRFMGDALVVEGRWGWLLAHDKSLFVWALVLLGPLSILCALPVQDAWRDTLRKTTQAGLALYAMAVALGIACVLVGVVLNVVAELTGGSGVDALRSLL